MTKKSPWERHENNLVNTETGDKVSMVELRHIIHSLGARPTQHRTMEDLLDKAVEMLTKNPPQ